MDLLSVTYSKNQSLYLSSCGQRYLKRLISEGMGDCFQLAHAFRKGDHSKIHAPEFMMAEWYRIGFSLDEMIDESLEFITLFLGSVDAITISYAEAFEHIFQLDYRKASTQEL